MLAGGMRNTIFAEYREKTDYLTFIDDDDYLMPEKMENLVKTIKQFRNLNNSKQFKTKMKILEFETYIVEDYNNRNESNGVWGCIYAMKNFNLVPMPSEIIWEDRIFKLLNCDKTENCIENDNFFYSHTKENNSVGKEINEQINTKGYIHIINMNDERHFNGFINIPAAIKIKIKNYLITHKITLEKILENYEKDNFNLHETIRGLLPIFLNCVNDLELPESEYLVSLQKENKLNELEIKKLSYQKLQAIDIEKSKQYKYNENIPEKDKIFDFIENKKIILKQEIEELKRTGGGKSLPKLTSDSNINPESDIRKYEIVKNGIGKYKCITANTFNNKILDKSLQEELNKLKESSKEFMQTQSLQ